MKTIKDIFDMIDLFYANKHLHDKIVKCRERNGRQFKSPYVGMM